MEETIAPVTRAALAALLGTRALVVCGSAVLSVLLVSLLRRRLDVAGRGRWQLVPLAWALLLAAGMGAAGLFGHALFSASGEADVARFANALALAGLVMASRPVADLVIDLADRRSERWGSGLQALRDLAALALALFAASTAIEVPWNWAVDELSLASRAFEALLLALALGFLFFLGQRSGLLVALGVVLACGIGIAQFLVIEFRGAPFLPSDVSAIGTAAAVSEGYDFVLDGRCLYAIKLTALAVAALSLVHPALGEGRRGRVRGVAYNLVPALALAGVAVGALTLHDWRPTFDMSDGWYWDERAAYQSRGFLPAFVAYWQDLKVELPEGYSVEVAKADERELVAAYEQSEGGRANEAARAQFDELRPSVIIVMNESFTDMSIFNGLNAGYEGPPFATGGLGDALAMGSVSMTAYGGGTANTEFELLTGVSVAYLGMGKIPYSIHDFGRTTSLVDQLEELGYQSVAIHPSNPNNYHRTKVYGQMGFEEFISGWDYPEDVEWYHSGPRDAVTYQTVLDLLAERDAPQFVFDVTMANHGGYLRGNTAAEDQQHIYPEGLAVDDPDTLNAQLNEFLACMHASDDDIAWFVDELRALDRPVVLLFFGDHQPSFSWRYNDYAFPEEDPTSVAHRARCYQTPYFIWANYDITGVAQTSGALDSSSEALVALTLGLIGAPLTDFQKATLAGHEQLAQVTGRGYTAGDGIWYTAQDEGPYSELYRQLSYVNYLEFGSAF